MMQKKNCVQPATSEMIASALVRGGGWYGGAPHPGAPGYGPGGGGVSYPDGYYFNLHGKILVIDFDGPYENDKTPTPETKKMELKVLASFREF